MKTQSDFEPATAYPLAWPLSWPRTPQHERKSALFGKKKETRWGYQTKQALSLADAVARLQDELCLLRAERVVISTNVALRQDGLPKARQKAPEDVGTALYFTLDGAPHCLPCDRWDRVADNLAAIAAHIRALRGIERWGVGDLKAAFAGYKALPENGTSAPWHVVLGVSVDADVDALRRAYRRQAMETHPDQGGSKEAFQAVQRALNEALEVAGI